MNSFGSDFKDSTAEVIVVVPVFDDWEAFEKLCEELHRAFDKAGLSQKYLVLAVNDAPHLSGDGVSFRPGLRARPEVIEIGLARNLGHQRAIAIGLSQALMCPNCRYCLVMDGDGEDAAGDALRLLNRAMELKGKRVVFAERSKRSEGWGFRSGYALYRVLHFLITGISIRFGNFSVIPSDMANIVAQSPEIWSHYAAAVVKCGIPIELVPTSRALRFSGQSHMSWVKLIAHGLGAISVFNEIAMVRLYLMALVAWVLALCLMALGILGGGAVSPVILLGGFGLFVVGMAVVGLTVVLGNLHARTLAGADLAEHSRRLVVEQNVCREVIQ